MPSPVCNGHRGPRITWNRELRLALHLLNEDFPDSSEYRTQIFNIIFKDHLAACRVPEGATVKTLYAQYVLSERQKHSSRGLWAGICEPPSTDRDREERRKLRERFGAAKIELMSNDSSTRPQPTVHTSAQPATTARRAPLLSRSRAASVSSGEGITVNSSREAVSDRSVLQTRAPAQRTPSKRKVDSNSVGHGLASPTSVKRPKKRPTNSSPTNNRSMRTDRVIRPRRLGGPIPVSPEDIPALTAPMAHIADKKAHPTPPALLFRVWSAKSQGINNHHAEGFVSGLHSQSNQPPQPITPLEFLWVSIEQHLDRNEKVLSPFISTATGLAWVLRQALTRSKAENEDQFVSVIDTSFLEQEAIFHAPPLHAEIKKKKAFTKGAWCYGGTIEFLIFQQIPAQAMLKTFSMTDLVQLATRTPAVGQALRLDGLAEPDWKKVQRTMKADRTDLVPATLNAMAKLLHFLGLHPASPLQHIQRAVSEVVQGWCLVPAKRNDEQWNETAAAFAHAFCRIRYPGTVRKDDIKLVFLYGVQIGVGKINALYNAEGVGKMQNSAKTYGLGNPVQIVLGRLAASARSVATYGEQQEERYSAAPSLLAPDSVVDDAMGEVETPTRPSAASFRSAQQTPSRSNSSSDQLSGQALSRWRPTQVQSQQYPPTPSTSDGRPPAQDSSTRPCRNMAPRSVYSLAEYHRTFGSDSESAPGAEEAEREEEVAVQNVRPGFWDCFAGWRRWGGDRLLGRG